MLGKDDQRLAERLKAAAEMMGVELPDYVLSKP